MFKFATYTFFIGAAAMTGPAMAGDYQSTPGDASRASGEVVLSSAGLAILGVAVVGVVALKPVFTAAHDSAEADRLSQDSERTHPSPRYDHAPLEVSPETVMAQPAPKVPYQVQTDTPPQGQN